MHVSEIMYKWKTFTHKINKGQITLSIHIIQLRYQRSVPDILSKSCYSTLQILEKVDDYLKQNVQQISVPVVQDDFVLT